MELEEMKTLWGRMSAEIEKQKTITDALVIKMTKAGYRDKINKIWMPELISALGCMAIIMFVLINLQQLNTWYLLVCGIATVAILLVLPILSMKAIYALRSINISKNNYKQSLQEYSKGKMQLVLVQKLGFFLIALLILVMLPVTTKLIAGKNFFMVTRFWFWYLIEFLFFYPTFKWVSGKYIKIVTDAENILKELEG